MPIKRTTLFVLLSATLILTACQTTKSSPEDSHQSPPQHEMRREVLQDWELESHQAGQLHWAMSAESAEHIQNMSQLNQWRWHFPNSWQIKAPKVQLQQDKILIQDLEGYRGLWKIQSPQAQINLESEQLSGKVLLMQHPQWQIKAQQFKSKSPLKQWALKDVYAKFES